MSRLLIKNIPASATSDSLRTHFLSSKNSAATITDVRVARKRDGTPRRFAFVGFKTDEQARAAKEWFDGTFWGPQRITVEIVQGVKDAPVPRPNKKRRLSGPERSLPKTDSSPMEFARKASKPIASSDGDDPLTAEFLNVMKPRNKKGPSWADIQAVGLLTPPARPETSQPATEEQNIIAKKDETTTDEAVSDLDWMKSRMSKGINESKIFEQSDEPQVQDSKLKPAPKVEEKSEPSAQELAKRTILDTRRLFVRNLAFSCTSEELQEVFGRFGQVDQIHIPLTSEHTSKGLAFVSYVKPEDAVAAWEALDGTTFQGRLLHILAGVERRKELAIPQDGKKTLKEMRGEQKKRDAGKEFNWGMLYMNSDAVVSSIADRMKIPKADILGAMEPEDSGISQNPAVKLALAETHVIQETKRYFEDQGVVLSALSARSRARSRTTVLIKNIPYGTTRETLQELFEPHGEIARLLMPQSGTLAVVEYVHSDEAARAFRSIAYRRLGNSVIYLEWAPEGLMEGPVASTANPDADVNVVTLHGQDDGVGDEENAIRSGLTLFVKNLSFVTTTERLASVFRRMPSFVFARVQTKPAPRNKAQDEERLSMGYGFVGFADPDAAKHALKSMQGFVLDGHKLHVAFAGRGADEAEGKSAELVKAKTAKMIVKNVPFEATKKDIRDLFGVYGTLKSVRLPKKFDSRTRGFAFLEFVSRHEAENAFAALKYTHLLGRHLVLDWASEGAQDIDALRRTVGVGFGGGSALPGQKRKLDMTLDAGDDDVASDE